MSSPTGSVDEDDWRPKPVREYNSARTRNFFSTIDKSAGSTFNIKAAVDACGLNQPDTGGAIFFSLVIVRAIED